MSFVGELEALTLFASFWSWTHVQLWSLCDLRRATKYVSSLKTGLREEDV